MQKSFSKLKINKSSTKKIKLAWDSVYRNEYDEGLKFLILGLLDKDFSLDGVIQEIKIKDQFNTSLANGIFMKELTL